MSSYSYNIWILSILFYKSAEIYEQQLLKIILLEKRLVFFSIECPKENTVVAKLQK